MVQLELWICDRNNVYFHPKEVIVSLIISNKETYNFITNMRWLITLILIKINLYISKISKILSRIEL